MNKDLIIKALVQLEDCIDYKMPVDGLGEEEKVFELREDLSYVARMMRKWLDDNIKEESEVEE